MSTARLLVVDDTLTSARLLADLLAAHGHAADIVHDGATALARIAADPPDGVLLDFEMPGLSGLDVCRRLRANPRFAALPVIMVTAHDTRDHKLAALDAGADDFVNKPFDRIELMARVRSLLRIKALIDEVERQKAELADWNEALERRVAEELARSNRLQVLQRFLSPQIARTLLDGDADRLLASHRGEIVVVFLDLRGYTSFSERAEPEEVMRALNSFHAAMGEAVQRHDGTVERFTGDGLMVFFNDPLPVPDAPDRALKMALEMRDAAAALCARWRARGHELGLGIGIAQGYATLGQIGFEGRIDYAAIGGVTNLAHRLCSHSAAGEILTVPRVLAEARTRFTSQPRGTMDLAGFSRAFEVVNVTGLAEAAA